MDRELHAAAIPCDGDGDVALIPTAEQAQSFLPGGRRAAAVLGSLSAIVKRGARKNRVFRIAATDQISSRDPGRLAETRAIPMRGPWRDHRAIRQESQHSHDA